ncbi:MAG: acetylxylan esterase [Isosphaeraceae bacterium]
MVRSGKLSKLIDSQEQDMARFSRREVLRLGLAGSAGLAWARDLPAVAEEGAVDLHRQLLDLAQRYQRERRARFAAIRTADELAALQDSLRRTFVRLLGGLPEPGGVPPARVTGRIDAGSYSIEKLAFESAPGYFVSALLYLPKDARGRSPGVLSPCGHSVNGKAAMPYQTLHANLASRGFVVLTYDPVGQGERSQFWDARTGKSRYDLSCGEHAVVGGALELLGTTFARYRIIDGRRALDYLTARPEVDASRIGCVGNSGGGNLTAYITALDPRVTVAAICCYITALPRRMANRIQEDPSSDPEQDVFGFVSEGLDHAGLLALCAPRPTLIGSAVKDFFPIEGARESFREARHLYEVAKAADRLAMVESPFRHGLTPPIREAVYGWFGRWLAGREDPAFAREIAIQTRSDADLLVCEQGQAGLSLHSRPLLSLARAEFRDRPRPPRKSLREMLAADLASAAPEIIRIGSEAPPARDLVVCVNGNDAPDWREEKALLDALGGAGATAVVVNPRGVASRRVALEVRGHGYTDPISGVEANLAYNAYLVGRTLLGLRVADVLAAVNMLRSEIRPRRIFLCGSHDAALVACLAAALDPGIDGLATEDLLLSYEALFAEQGYPLNAARIVPGFLRDFGDISDVLDQIRPRRVLIAAGIEAGGGKAPAFANVAAGRFRSEPRLLADWLRG